MLLPAVCSVIYGEDDLYVFLISSFVTVLSGLGLELFNRPSEEIRDIDRMSGFLIVSLCWIGAGLAGSLPYIIYGVFSPADAFFESVSGFTTTGATVLVNFDNIPHGIFFWRSFTQWLGGMGIILLAVAILPRLSVGGMQLAGREMSGMTTEKITPRIAETAKKLWAVYLFLTFLLLILLFLAGMTLFDSFLHTFTTLATGGFSPKALSIAAYESVFIELLITVFMFLAGVNFVLHYLIFKGRFSKILKSSEFKFYLLLNIGFIILATMILWISSYYDFLQSLRYGSFQVISISTTTGFATADFNYWPSSVQSILIVLMFIGACSGSTTGSIKCIRILVLFKKGYRELKKLIHPKGVYPITIDKKPVEDNIISGIASFFILYIFIAFASTLILLFLEDISMITAFSATAATLGVIGPGLDAVGPMENYAFLSVYTKIFLSVLMIVGRLELYAILVILTPAFWKR